MKNLLKIFVLICSVASLNAQTVTKASLKVDNTEKISLSKTVASQLGYSSLTTKPLETYHYTTSTDGTASLSIPIDTKNSKMVSQSRAGGICIRIYIASRKSNCLSGIGFRCKAVTGCNDNPNELQQIRSQTSSRYVNAIASVVSNKLVLKLEKDINAL